MHGSKMDVSDRRFEVSYKLLSFEELNATNSTTLPHPG
jgi:hypothetical protein